MSERAKCLAHKEQYVEWFNRYNWHWMATLTFRTFPRVSRAQTTFDRWIAQLQNMSKDSVYWFRTLEYGGLNSRAHYHALLMFSAPLKKVTIDDATNLWELMAGDARIVVYDREKGGIRYCLKSMESGNDYDIDFELPSWRMPYWMRQKSKLFYNEKNSARRYANHTNYSN